MIISPHCEAEILKSAPWNNLLVYVRFLVDECSMLWIFVNMSKSKASGTEIEYLKVYRKLIKKLTAFDFKLINLLLGNCYNFLLKETIFNSCWFYICYTKALFSSTSSPRRLLFQYFFQFITEWPGNYNGHQQHFSHFVLSFMLGKVIDSFHVIDIMAATYTGPIESVHSLWKRENANLPSDAKGNRLFSGR